MMIEAIKEIAQYYGYESQTRQAVEELAELIQAISKHKSIFSTPLIPKTIPCKEKAHVIEEMADVTIMMIQLKTLLGISDDDINREMVKKVERQQERMCADLRNNPGNESVLSYIKRLFGGKR